MISALLGLIGIRRKLGIHERKASRIEFLSEQDGQVERELKSQWSVILRNYGVERAYLVNIQIAGEPQPTIALALSKGLFPEREIIEALSKVFSAVMGSSQFVDMMFIGKEDEVRAAAVCKSFMADSRGPTHAA